MVTLTEDMVLLRTKCKGLEFVRKLNIWGAGINDISVVRRMPLLEVVSCSVNNISTLADFGHCPRLQELFIRKNNIEELVEICHLKNLPDLTSLWLLDNPCASENNYRSTVLRNLPRLQKLDNVPVTREEVQQAAVCGEVLSLVSDDLESSASTAADVRSSTNAALDVNVVQKNHQKDPKSGTDNSAGETQSVTKSLCIPSKNPEQEDTLATKTAIFIERLDKLKEKNEAVHTASSAREKSMNEKTEKGLQQNQKESNVMQALSLLVQDLDRRELLILQELVNRRLADLP